MAPEDNTSTPKAFQRCPDCHHSELITVKLPDDRIEQACPKCPWETPGFRKLKVERKRTPVDIAMQQMQEQLQRDRDAAVRWGERAAEQITREISGISELGQRVLDRQRKFPDRTAPPVPAKVAKYSASEVSTTANSLPDAQSAQKRQSGQGRRPDEKRERSRDAIRDILQKNSQRVLDRTMRMSDVIALLVQAGAPCYRKEGWNDTTVLKLISEEMVNFRKAPSK
jgi:hypothetical protein